MSKFSSQEPVQFPLQLTLSEDTSFDNYFFANNAEAINSLKDPGQTLIFIWGTESVGKTHLLQALFNFYLEQDLSAYYLPFRQIDGLSVEMLENLEQQKLLCLDDIHLVAGKDEWEQAIFHLFNRFKETGNKLIFSANANAENVPFFLPDLKSRLQWGLTYQLQALSDDDKIKVLKIRAEEKQWSLSDEVAAFLIRRVSRDMQQLIVLLDKLDYASLAQQRKLTIPFVKKYLDL